MTIAEHFQSDRKPQAVPSKIKIHMSRVRRNPFGGTTYGTLCNRLRVLSDGMNLTDNPEEVTCHFCKRLLARQPKRPA